MKKVYLYCDGNLYNIFQQKVVIVKIVNWLVIKVKKIQNYCIYFFDF